MTDEPVFLFIATYADPPGLLSDAASERGQSDRRRSIPDPGHQIPLSAQGVGWSQSRLSDGRAGSEAAWPPSNSR